MLKFKGDAIELSGLTGTKIKSDLLGRYYRLWWSITSGGPVQRHGYRTSIVDLNAATGENFIKETGEIVLGSSGHAVELKLGTEETENLYVILIEEDAECCSHLENVLRKRWPHNDWEHPETFGVFPFTGELSEAVTFLEENAKQLGNSLILFDPLLYTPWESIDSVARSRIRNFYDTRTEFIIFLFTSDLISGRKEFSALPKKLHGFSQTERLTVEKADSLFGEEDWRSELLVNRSPVERAETIVDLYRQKLRAWFRYVLPLPFAPKDNQLYHLFFCSNYEAGIRITKKFYADLTGNAVYLPSNRVAFTNFKKRHPKFEYKGAKRPSEWKILWKAITQHEGGICDVYCTDLYKEEENFKLRTAALQWLFQESYLQRLDVKVPWLNPPEMYCLDWNFVESVLEIKRPDEFRPLRPSDLMKSGV